ncbi:DedA family protein [Candidatus Acetothermia bacterium]|nr:DedA family protein [Candidatus Acetothermia bacterium]
MQYGYFAVFFGVMLENAGLPVPGETILLGTAYFASQGHFQIEWVILIAFVSAVMGDNIGFWVGRLLGRRVLEKYGKYVGLSESRLRALDLFFETRGTKLVFVARFIAFFRVFTALFAGSSKMAWPVFLKFNVLGALLWSIVIGGLGFLFGSVEDLFNNWVATVGFAGFVLLILWIFSGSIKRIILGLPKAEKSGIKPEIKSEVKS